MTDIVERLRKLDDPLLALEAADEIESLRIQLKQAEERAEFAWKNTNTLERERQRLESLLNCNEISRN